MNLETPGADHLRRAPELGILVALEAALAITIAALAAAHPALYDVPVDPDDYTVDVDAAATLARQAVDMLVTIARYRGALNDPDFGIF
jgi:hypothetical protein